MPEAAAPRKTVKSSAHKGRPLKRLRGQLDCSGIFCGICLRVAEAAIPVLKWTSHAPAAAAVRD